MTHRTILKEVLMKGNSLVIRFDKGEKKFYNLKPGIFVQIEIVEVINARHKKV